MKVLKELIRIDKLADTPVYLQIANSVMNNIRRGHLRPGIKLPSSRELSDLLNIHRKTSQNAYDELMAQGWIEILPRRGAFVVKNLPEIKPIKLTTPGTLYSYPEKTNFFVNERELVCFPKPTPKNPNEIKLDSGLPDMRLLPTEFILREFRSLTKRNTFRKYLNYGDPRGPLYLLETLANYLTDTRGIPISERNLLITKGAQMGIYLTSQLLIKQGDVVITGEPGYFSATLTFKQAGANVKSVPVDDFGINVDKIEAICRKTKVRLVYVISHHHFPTTVTLSPERRIKLLELASQYKFAIIEDDYDYDFHYTSNPVLPMASLDYSGNVIYIGTLTKSLVPAIRLGFIAAPENFINTVSQLRRAVDWQGDSMMEVAIAELFKNGTIGRHIKKVVKLYHQRRDYFCAQLKDKIGERISFKIPEGGMAVWATFNDCNLELLAKRALRNGLVIGNGKGYSITTMDYNSTRLGFASLNFTEQDRAIDLLYKSM